MLHNLSLHPGEGGKDAIFLGANGIEFAGAAESDDQQQATHQAADDRRCDDFSGQGVGTVPLITAISTVWLSVTHPCLIHTLLIPAPEVARLAMPAAPLIRSISAERLIVAAVRRQVAGCGARGAGSSTGEVPRWAARATFLIGAISTVPGAITALCLAIATLA